MKRKARTGKIARLPKEIRERLNQHLEAGMPAPKLLDWLHRHVEVLEVLVRDFGGRLISEQNLSEWRQGGFQDWLYLQERKVQLRLIDEQAEDLQGSVKSGLTDRLALLLTARYAEMVAELSGQLDMSKARDREKLRQLCEEVTALRRMDHGAERLRIERAQLELAQAEFQSAEEARKKRTDAEWREWAWVRTREMLRRCGADAEIKLLAYEQLYGPLEGQQREDFLEMARKEADGAGSSANTEKPPVPNAEAFGGQAGKGSAHDEEQGNQTQSN